MCGGFQKKIESFGDLSDFAIVQCQVRSSQILFFFFLPPRTLLASIIYHPDENCSNLALVTMWHLTLWSFSRFSSLSGIPLRLGGMYQKQTLVC